MLKVLIAEDDLMMADMLSDIVVGAGYRVCGIARTVDEGVALGELHKPDLALLDLRLANGELGTAIAAQLGRGSEMGVLYATGNAAQVKLTSDNGQASLGKPYRSNDVIRALELVTEMVNTGAASKPFPTGFHVLPPPASSGAMLDADGLDQRDADIARLLRQQAALAAFGSFALGESDLDKVLNEAARVCALSLHVPFCKVCRYRPEENDLLVEAGVGWHQGVIGGVVSRADISSPQGRAFTTGEPVICEDLRRDTSFLLPEFYAEHGIVSTLDVIIRKKEGKPWGVLEIDNPQQHVYDERDINFVTGFANVLAEAVETSKRNVAAQRSLDRMKDMIADRDRLLAGQARLLSEKATLARELQHRVRNNLHLVYSMLNRQAESIDEDGGRAGIAAIARRVMSLAQVYDHLLGTGLTRTIDFGAYLSSLCESVKDLENPQHRDIKLTCACQPLALDLDDATALGLVTVELLANCFLHAFPKGVGSIAVSLTKNEAGDTGQLKFADDGVGFIEPAESKRRGLSLVRRLVQQVDGAAAMSSEHGTTWTLSFPIKTS